MTTSTEATPRSAATHERDVIDQLAGITPDSALAQLRAQRPDITRYAQSSYQTLLEPEDLGGVSHAERELIALRVATLTNTPALAEWHSARLRQLGTSDATIAAIQSESGGAALEPREAALVRHVDLVARTAVKATPDNVAALKAAGFSARDIVTLSELIAFLAFQVRALAGLRALAEEV